MNKHPILELDYAVLEDIAHAVEPDGKRTDLHAVTAAKAFNVPVDKVTPDMRRIAKTRNFGDVYGMSPERSDAFFKVHVWRYRRG